MDMVKRILTFFNYWYVRYLMATELYMVEPWEKATIYLVVSILFGVVWFFNYSIVLSTVSQLRGSSSNWAETLDSRGGL